MFLQIGPALDELVPETGGIESVRSHVHLIDAGHLPQLREKENPHPHQ